MTTSSSLFLKVFLLKILLLGSSNIFAESSYGTKAEQAKLLVDRGYFSEEDLRALEEVTTSILWSEQGRSIIDCLTWFDLFNIPTAVSTIPSYQERCLVNIEDDFSKEPIYMSLFLLGLIYPYSMYPSQQVLAKRLIGVECPEISQISESSLNCAQIIFAEWRPALLKRKTLASQQIMNLEEIDRMIFENFLISSPDRLTFNATLQRYLLIENISLIPLPKVLEQSKLQDINIIHSLIQENSALLQFYLQIILESPLDEKSIIQLSTLITGIDCVNPKTPKLCVQDLAKKIRALSKKKESCRN